jgi:hypothetical protein
MAMMGFVALAGAGLSKEGQARRIREPRTGGR